MNKNDIRKIMLDKRRKINNKDYLSTIIVSKIIDLDIYKKAKAIAIYKSLDSEVNTNDLIIESLKSKVVLLPRIVNNEIVFIEINKNTEYIKSRIGVLEPIGNVYDGSIDLIIVPGISFDKELNRLGFGMGYYDKYLSKKNIYKIGICFDNQVIDLLPTDDNDIKMDLVITEKKIIKKV